MNRSQFNEALEKLERAPAKKKVLLLVLAGHIDTEIAVKTNTKEGTVRKQISNIYQSFGIKGEYKGDRRPRRDDLVAQFRKYKPEWVSDFPAIVKNEVSIAQTAEVAEQEGAIAKPHRESTEAIDASANGLSCKAEVEYSCYRLWELLAASQWLQADRETLDILLKVSGREKGRCLRVEDIQKISCQVLRTIDQLWVEYSQERFGFSIQQKLIRLSRGDTDIETWLQFALRVGWRKNNNLWLTWLEIEVKRQTLGGNIAEQFPVGFFPYQYSFRSKFPPGPIGDLLEPTPVSAYLLLHGDF